MPGNPLEYRMSHLEGAYEQTSLRLASIDARFASIDARFASIDARFNAVDARFDTLDRKVDALAVRLDSKIDNRFMWTIGVVLGTWLTTIMAVFFHH